MKNITRLDDYRPHISGNALCLQCDYRWVAIAPIGTVELECTECGTWKGVFEGMTAPETVWECNCGNQHFYIDEEGVMCAKCGLRQQGF
jgi:hypothetical protein